MSLGTLLIALGAIVWLIRAVGWTLGSLDLAWLGAGLIALGCALGGVTWPPRRTA